jgi:integrase
MSLALRNLSALAGPGATTADLTPALIVRFAASNPRHRPATTDGLLRAVKAACAIAVLEGHLAVSPFFGRSFWRSSAADVPRNSRAITRAEVAKVLDRLRRDSGSWEGGRLHALAAILAYCGLRKTEALMLRVEDVDLASGLIRVVRRGKALKTRSSEAAVPIPRAARAILATWMPRCGSAWLIPGVRKEKPWTGGRSGRRPIDGIKAAGEAVGVKGLTLHMLRHSLATHLRGHWGLSGQQVQMVLRHSNQRTQELYCHEDFANLVALVQDFDFAEPSARQPKPKPRSIARHGHVLPRRSLLRPPSPAA